MPVAASQRVQVVTLTLEDNNLKTATMSFNMPAAWEATALVSLEFLDNIVDAVIAASDCRVKTMTISRELVVLGNRFAIGAVPASAEVERKLVLSFLTDLDTSVQMRLPSPRFEMEDDGTDNVALDNIFVEPIITAIVNGPLGPLNGPVSNQLRPIASAREAFVSHTNRPRR